MRRTWKSATAKMIVVLSLLVTSCYGLSPAEEAKVKHAAREFIKERLKAPATAQFSKETICVALGKADMDSAKGLTPMPPCTVPKTLNIDSGIIYRTAVDAQNSFGALIRTKFELSVIVENGKVSFFDHLEALRLLKDGCEQVNSYKKELGRADLEDCAAQFPALYRQ